MKSIPRWLIGALIGPVVGIGLAFLLASRSGEGATMSGMANIAYLLAFLMHVGLFALVYGLLLPIWKPRTAAATRPSLVSMAVIATVILLHLAYQLGFFASVALDRYAMRTLLASVLAMPIGGLVTWWIGLRRN